MSVHCQSSYLLFVPLTRTQPPSTAPSQMSQISPFTRTFTPTPTHKCHPNYYSQSWNRRATHKATNDATVPFMPHEAGRLCKDVIMTSRITSKGPSTVELTFTFILVHDSLTITPLTTTIHYWQTVGLMWRKWTDGMKSYGYTALFHTYQGKTHHPPKPLHPCTNTRKNLLTTSFLFLR